MTLSCSAKPKTSVVIPLYKSTAFRDGIKANIQAMPETGVEILISDRHCYDDSIDYFREYYADDNRVRCIQHQDKLDWVGHINALLKEAQGEYWRFLPHDDLSPAGTLESLIKALDENPQMVLAYGPTQAIEADGHALPDKYRLAPHPLEAEQGWTLDLVLQMFWKSYFDGAFKGLIRRDLILEKQLWIRSTKAQVFPERCWLFALCLLGPFQFVSEAMYIKRFHQDSLHTNWIITGDSFTNIGQTMEAYIDQLLGKGPVANYCIRDIQLNAQCMAQWQDKQVGERPLYKAFSDILDTQIRRLELPLMTTGQDKGNASQQ